MSGALYPHLEPYDSGLLEVGQGNSIYWEECGNPAGKPVLILHGGPGSGVTPWWRRLFDPELYRVVLFDQRGCGRSTPNAGDVATDLSTNSTGHLLSDIERLRRETGVERWAVLGGSWGSTLALAYAERRPERVTDMILFAVVTTTRREVEWITRDMGRLFPEEWERFRDVVDGADDIVAAYVRRLADPDPSVRAAAARGWCAWEATHVGGGTGQPDDERFTDAGFRMTFARLVTHYWSHHAWLREDQLLRDAGLLDGIPGVLVHGRRDVSSPLDVPWELSARWREAELVVVEDAGHSGEAMSHAIVAATDRLARPSRN